VADSTVTFLADWKGETGSRAKGPWSPERALFSWVLCGAVVRARISRSATASCEALRAS